MAIDSAVLAAANSALSDFVNRTPAFHNTEANCKALQKFLKKSGVPIEQWVLGAWVGAFWACNQPNAEFPLESAPRPETKEERAARLEARDRRDGDLQSNASLAEPRESPREKRLRGYKERDERIATQIKEQQFQKDEAARKEKAANDLSIVPTIQALIDNPMSESEAAAWASVEGRSTVQIRKLLSNRQQAAQESTRRFYKERAGQ